jgi:DNA repair exonuclease SbcCD nuclease subunit
MDAERPGMEIRLIQRIVNTVYREANKRGAKVVVFGGDLFESKKMWRSDIATAVYSSILDAMSEAKTVRLNVFLAGNHDLYGGNCSLTPFRSSHAPVAVVDNTAQNITVSVPEGDDYILRFAPCGTEQEDPGSNWDLAFVHGNIPSARMTSTMVEKVGTIHPRYLERATNKQGMVLAGHYHTPQTIQQNGKPVVVVCGAPMYHDWSDLDAKTGRGCLFVSIRHSETEPGIIGTKHRIPFDWAPRFLSDPNEGREDIDDFIRPVIEKSALPTEVHTNHKKVGSFDPGVSLLSYLKKTVPSKQERIRLLPLGINLWKGDK